MTTAAKFRKGDRVVDKDGREWELVDTGVVYNKPFWEVKCPTTGDDKSIWEQELRPDPKYPRAMQGIRGSYKAGSRAPAGAQGTAVCTHKWKQYVGIFEVYNYCELCDVKKD